MRWEKITIVITQFNLMYQWQKASFQLYQRPITQVSHLYQVSRLAKSNFKFLTVSPMHHHLIILCGSVLQVKSNATIAISLQEQTISSMRPNAFLMEQVCITSRTPKASAISLLYINYRIKEHLLNYFTAAQETFFSSSDVKIKSSVYQCISITLDAASVWIILS